MSGATITAAQQPADAPTPPLPRIVPVIDLKQGLVVRGVAGDRANYRPVASRLTPLSEPGAVAQALRVATGAREMYVADLDALAGQAPQVDAYRRMTACGARLWIDAGVVGASHAAALLDRFRREAVFSPANTPVVVVASETLAGPEELSACAAALGHDWAFSLDLDEGRPRTRHAPWSAAAPETLAASALVAGAPRLIVLDVRRVGVYSGPSTLDLCRCLRARWPGVELVSGGGVRHTGDLEALARAGCDAALVGSALHDGRLP